MNHLLAGIVIVWAQLIRLKRFFVPRPFRLVKIRRRCPGCNRRLRGAIIAADGAPGVFACQRCVTRLQRGLRT